MRTIPSWRHERQRPSVAHQFRDLGAGQFPVLFVDSECLAAWPRPQSRANPDVRRSLRTHRGLPCVDPSGGEEQPQQLQFMAGRSHALHTDRSSLVSAGRALRLPQFRTIPDPDAERYGSVFSIGLLELRLPPFRRGFFLLVERFGAAGLGFGDLSFDWSRFAATSRSISRTLANMAAASVAASASSLFSLIAGRIAHAG